jgi:succinate-acetate transporter protein
MDFVKSLLNVELPVWMSLAVAGIGLLLLYVVYAVVRSITRKIIGVFGLFGGFPSVKAGPMVYGPLFAVGLTLAMVSGGFWNQEIKDYPEYLRSDRLSRWMIDKDATPEKIQLAISFAEKMQSSSIHQFLVTDAEPPKISVPLPFAMGGFGFGISLVLLSFVAFGRWIYYIC